MMSQWERSWDLYCRQSQANRCLRSAHQHYSIDRIRKRGSLTAQTAFRILASNCGVAVRSCFASVKWKGLRRRLWIQDPVEPCFLSNRATLRHAENRCYRISEFGKHHGELCHPCAKKYTQLSDPCISTAHSRIRALRSSISPASSCVFFNAAMRRAQSVMSGRMSTRGRYSTSSVSCYVSNGKDCGRIFGCRIQWGRATHRIELL